MAHLEGFDVLLQAVQALGKVVALLDEQRRPRQSEDAAAMLQINQDHLVEGFGGDGRVGIGKAQFDHAGVLDRQHLQLRGEADHGLIEARVPPRLLRVHIGLRCATAEQRVPPRGQARQQSGRRRLRGCVLIPGSVFGIAFRVAQGGVQMV